MREEKSVKDSKKESGDYTKDVAVPTETLSNISPRDVDPDMAQRVLEFLNSARTAKEIADTIELAEKRDVGINTAEQIMSRRAQLGQFKSLEDILNIPTIGPNRFTDIVASVGGIKTQVEPERALFNTLILKNPNYFGNIKSPLQPVKVISSNTKYEELTCVGYNPQFKRLEAVVHVKLEVGYSGGICSKGSQEYVRFYIDWNNSGIWSDLGLVSFTVYNITGKKPLEYDITLFIDPKEKFCLFENLPRVKAILSWNIPPPPNTPSHIPVWGNVKDSRIQIDAWKFFVLKDLVKEIKLKGIPELEKLIDFEQPLPIPMPKQLSVAELSSLYKESGVPSHRFGFSEVQKMISQPAFLDPLVSSNFKELNIDLPNLIDNLLKTNGNTQYEELTCVGLNRDLDTLVGIIKVKLPGGYSGKLCSAGSIEYVGFWVDWGDGAGWSYEGTTSVNVHDIMGMPPEGLDYAVFLPLNTLKHKILCKQGAKIVKVRAILSWNTPPPPFNPNHIPTWGNRKQTLVQINPRILSLEGHTPLIDTVGNMSVSEINSTTGLADGVAVGAGFTAQESPFGGEVVITGYIANPPDVVGGGAAPLKYKVYVSDNNGASWQPLSNGFTIFLTRNVDGLWVPPFPFPVSQSVDPSGWYTYYEDLTNTPGPGNATQRVSQNVLAKWHTGPGMTGLWKIKIEAKDSSDTIYPGVAEVTVRLDNTRPTSNIAITSGAGACGDFLIGDPISGTYSVSDEHFGTLRFSVEPAVGSPVFTSPALVANTRSYPTVPTVGESGTWSLDTSHMLRCGYVIRLVSVDRTIVNSGGIGWESPAAVVGLCLRESIEG